MTNYCDKCGAPAIHYLEFTRRIAGYLCTFHYLGIVLGGGKQQRALRVPPPLLQDTPHDPVGVVAQDPPPNRTPDFGSHAYEPPYYRFPWDW